MTRFAPPQADTTDTIHAVGREALPVPGFRGHRRAPPNVAAFEAGYAALYFEGGNL